MSKAYSMFRADLAGAAEVEAYVAANPTDFTIGTQITAADGTTCIVSAAGVTGLITVTAPTP